MVSILATSDVKQIKATVKSSHDEHDLENIPLRSEVRGGGGH